ncbi:hypothetical protein [Micromonospora sp. NPDC005806]|uniref:hypothetical protein n=1 Tax=Micromonospora sp. NPDC005806 TaxID=3364234 RepID=UPI0036825D09
MTEGFPSAPPPAPGPPFPGPYQPPAPAGSYQPPASAGSYPPPPQPTLAGPYPRPAGPYGPPAMPYGPPPVPPPAGKKSKRWLWITLTAVVVVLALCAGSLTVVAQQLDRLTAGAAADDERGPIKPAEIEALLNGHTRALGKRDLAAFTAPFDKKLVARQTILFRNLLKVPFAEARFAKFRQGPFTTVGAGWSVELTLSFVHRFEYDLAPVDELYTWTVVRARAGAPLSVIAVGHLPKGWTAPELSYHPAPWDRWRNLHVEKTAHTVLIVDASLRTQARRYAPIAERAAVADLAAWRAGGGFDQIPQGFVYSLVKGKKELGALYQSGQKGGRSESAITIPFVPTTTDERYEDGPDHGASRVVVDVVDPYFFQSGDRDLPPELFRHEFAHAMADNIAGHDREEFNLDGLQNWVTEGFAEYVGHQKQSWMRSDLTADGRDLLRTLGYDVSLPTNDDWDLSGRVNYHYWLAHSAMSFVADRYGDRKVFDLVDTHYRGKKIEEAVQQVLGLSYDEFTERWSAYVVAKAR